MASFTVYNMLSPVSFKPVVGQFHIVTNDGGYFQSYTSMIAFRANGGQIYLDINKWDFSKTTMKYLSVFLDERPEVIRARVKNGEYYNLIDMNSGE